MGQGLADLAFGNFMLSFGHRLGYRFKPAYGVEMLA